MGKPKVDRAGYLILVLILLVSLLSNGVFYATNAVFSEILLGMSLAGASVLAIFSISILVRARKEPRPTGTKFLAWFGLGASLLFLYGWFRILYLVSSIMSKIYPSS